MKIILLFILVSFGTSSYAQLDSLKVFSISIDANQPQPIGNNFLSKAFDSKVGFGLSLQYNLKSIFIAYKFQSTTYAITDQSYFGNFESAESSRQNLIVGVRQKFSSNHLYLEHGIGMGTHSIKSYGPFSSYINSGNNYVLFSRLHYSISDVFDVFFATEFEYTHFNTVIDGPFKDFYTNTYQIVPTLGLKFKIGKPKKFKWI